MAASSLLLNAPCSKALAVAPSTLSTRSTRNVSTIPTLRTCRLASSSNKLLAARSQPVQRRRTLSVSAKGAVESQKVKDAVTVPAELRESEKHPGDAYFATDKRPIILFDGVCNLCNNGVNFMLDHDHKGNLRFTALQSEAGRALLHRANRSPDDLTSIVLVEPNKVYIRSEAILHIAQYLHQPLIAFGKLGLFVPGFVRDRFYNLIAYNRYSIMGKRNMCRIGDTRFNDRFVA